MKILTIILSLVLIAFYSCSNVEKNKEETHQIVNQLSPFLQLEDSLTIIFDEKNFLSTLDTLKLSGKEMPESLSNNRNLFVIKFIRIKYKMCSRRIC